MNEPPLLRLVALVALVGTYLGLGLGRVPACGSTGRGSPSSARPSWSSAAWIRWDQAVAAVDAPPPWCCFSG